MTTIRPMKLMGLFTLGLAALLMGALLALLTAGYTVRVDLWGSGDAGLPAGIPAPPTLAPATAIPATATPPPAATATPAPVLPTATLAPAALDLDGPPFRVVMDGQATTLAWNEVQALVAPDATGRLVVDRAAVRALVQRLAKDVDQPAQRAAFHWNEATSRAEVVVESHPGRALDVEAAVAQLAAALEGGHGVDVPLPVNSVAPEWTSDRVPTFGTDIVGEGQIYYGDDDAATIQNVEQGALALDGAVALPGAIFSHDAWVYDGREYAPSYTIIGDRTLLAPGGGLCIVATTLFQTSFWAGLPIVERHNHPYWISMYTMEVAGQTYKGLDATVGDMRFRNTTGAPLRIKAWTADGTLHIQLIGTKPNWQVRVRDYAISNFQPALSTVSYFDEPSLPRGQQEVARNPHDGFDATITREVVQDGQVIDTYVAASHYQVTEKQVMVGTGE